MERDRVIADRGPQPGAARPVFPAKLLDAPAGLVGMAQRRLVLVRKDRLGQRLEQRHEPLQAVGQRPRRDRQPWLEIHAATRCRGRKQAQCSNRKRAQKLVP